MIAHKRFSGLVVASSYDLLELFICQLLVVFGGAHAILHLLHIKSGFLAGLPDRVNACLLFLPLLLALSGLLDGFSLLLFLIRLVGFHGDALRILLEVLGIVLAHF